jgi:hypothetical protein
MVKFMG